MMLQPIGHERSAVVIRAGNEVAVAGGCRYGRLLSGHCRQLGVQQHGMKRRRLGELLLLLLAKQVTEVLLVQVGVEDIRVGIRRRRLLNRRRTEGYPGTSGRRISDVRLYRRRRRRGRRFVVLFDQRRYVKSAKRFVLPGGPRDGGRMKR
jgi:hypothetical protein